MGKRSDFARVERDFYPTPAEAVKPLIPHVPHNCTYWEPCAGDGALIRALDGHARCLFASDISPQRPDIETRDALSDGSGAFEDYIITNPPWDRRVLHPMIDHFSAMRPTWLLFDADWPHTKQSARFMPWLRKIVSVGRVRWIPDSKMTGKDNCAWYLFDQNDQGPTEFFGRMG